MTTVRQFALALLLLPSIALASPATDARLQGEQLLHAGKLDEAVDALEHAVDLAPGDADAHFLLGQAYGSQASGAGMFTALRLAGRVHDQFAKAVALDPDNLDYREGLLQFFIQAPGPLGGSMSKAREQAAEIAKRDAVRGHMAEAQLLRADGKPEQALAAYRAAAAARPDDAQLAVVIAIALQDLKRWDEAFAELDATVARDPAAMNAWYQLGRTAVLAQRRLADGEAALKRYLAHEPARNEPPLAAAHWRLGMIYEAMRRTAEARAEYEAALKLDPAQKDAKAALKRLG